VMRSYPILLYKVKEDDTALYQPVYRAWERLGVRMLTGLNWLRTGTDAACS
jgi:hypothetical protein